MKPISEMIRGFEKSGIASVRIVLTNGKVLAWAKDKPAQAMKPDDIFRYPE